MQRFLRALIMTKFCGRIIRSLKSFPTYGKEAHMGKLLKGKNLVEESLKEKTEIFVGYATSV